MATTYGKMGILFYEKEDFPTSLECSIQAYLIFSQIGSPKAFQALKNMHTLRTRLSESEFKEILKKYNIPLDASDGYE